MFDFKLLDLPYLTRNNPNDDHVMDRTNKEVLFFFGGMHESETGGTYINQDVYYMNGLGPPYKHAQKLLQDRKEHR